MRIAIVHDWLVTDAGAEKVLRAILDIYPESDVFSLVDFLDGEQRESVLCGRYAKASFIQKLPFAKKHFRNYLPLFPKAIESFDLSSYDLVISSSWAVAKGVRTHKNQKHICYCHTPIRYAWDLYDEYTSALSQPKKLLVKSTLGYIKKWDVRNSKRVDKFISNSAFVSERIKRTYGRESSVIYPPVDVKSFALCEDKEDFYLVASRLVSYKKISLIVEAFVAMPEKKLVVIGEGEEFELIKSIATANIEILGYRDKESLIGYMQKAKAFVYVAIEDFGIVPVEAQACGTPVIALSKGGTAETVIGGETGVHFDNQSAEDIINAVERFENMIFDSKKVSQSVQRFSSERFKKEFEEFVVKSLAYS